MSGRTVSTACCLALALLAPSGKAATTSNAAAAKEELRQLKAKIDAVQKRLADAEESKSDAADALKDSERAISEANRALGELGEQSRAANTRVTQLKQEAARAEDALKAQRTALSRMLYQQYAAGRPETFSILLNGRDPNAIARDLHYLTYVGRARAELIASVRANLARLNELAEEAREKAAELDLVAKAQAKQRRRLDREKRTRARVLATISLDIEQQRRTIGTLRRDETRLARLIEQLARVIARAPKTRAPREVRPQPRLRNERVPDRDLEGAFAQLRGHLALPVRGELANRFGSPRQDGGTVWKGLFIAARAGEEVRAIASGRVVFADWLRGFGNLLIVDHGEGYMSLYGYNETLFKRVGDSIRGGEKVAAVGNTGGHSDSGLYFEMRHEGRPFDPMSWVSVR